jgi:hypothetical protein
MKRYLRKVAATMISVGGLFAATTVAWAAPAGTDSTGKCDPSPKTAASFCVSYGETLPGALDAAAPADLQFSLSNTSAQHLTDESEWVKTVTLTALSASSGSGTGVLTPSNQLPDNLVIAGDDDCGPDASGSFATCAAGSGTFTADVTGTPGGLFDGFYQGHVGILRVLNVAGTTGTAVHYRASVEVCIAITALGFNLGNCAINAQQTYDLTGTPGTPGVLTFQVESSGSQFIGGCGCTLSYTGTIDQATVHLRGSADHVDSGTGPVPAGKTYTTLRLPATCGAAEARAVFASFQATPRTVTFTPSETITGCPHAAFTGDLGGSVVTFDGSGSATPLPGRHVAAWTWGFGDGTTATGSAPVMTHAYPASPRRPRDYTITLRVADSAGALSTIARLTIHGTATTFTLARTSSVIKVAGSVRPPRPGRPVQITLLRKAGRTFRILATRTLTLTATSHFTTRFARPARGTCRLITRFPGDRSQLASQLTRTFAC